jgi:hypothetical protein
MGATVLGTNYCHECYSRRNHPCNAPPAADGWCPECEMVTVVLPNICAKCQEKRDNRCTCDEDTERNCAPCDRRIADAAEYDVWCGVDEPHCECDGSGRMCDLCAEEYAEPCRGCGVPSQLWTDNTYCRPCYVERHGDEFPNRHAAAHAEEITDLHIALGRAIAESDTRSQEQIQLLLEDHGYTVHRNSVSSPFPPLPPSPPRHTSLQSMRDEIAEIEERLNTNMTKSQKDDWIWLLQNRRADLAEAEKEMWDQFDADDLRKLDLQNRRGF